MNGRKFAHEKFRGDVLPISVPPPSVMRPARELVQKYIDGRGGDLIEFITYVQRNALEGAAQAFDPHSDVPALIRSFKP